MNNPTVLMLGPHRAAVSGVSTHLNLLMDSTLADDYDIVHFQVGSEGRDEGAFGKLVRLLVSPFFLAASIRSKMPFAPSMRPTNATSAPGRSAGTDCGSVTGLGIETTRGFGVMERIHACQRSETVMMQAASSRKRRTTRRCSGEHSFS